MGQQRPPTPIPWCRSSSTVESTTDSSSCTHGSTEWFRRRRAPDATEKCWPPSTGASVCSDGGVGVTERRPEYVGAQHRQGDERAGKDAEPWLGMFPGAFIFLTV